MNRLEKILKKELDGNEDAIQSMLEHYRSCLEAFEKIEEKDITEAEANIQKILTDLANNDPDDVIKNLYEQIANKDNSITNIERLERIASYLFEEIQERKVVKGLKGK